MSSTCKKQGKGTDRCNTLMNLRILFMTGVAVGVVFGSSVSKADDASRRNAALHYWQAFAFMPPLSKKVDNAITIQTIVRPVDQELVQVIQQSKSALQLFHRGAKLSHCDWELDVEKDGLKTWSPHLDKAHPFIRLPLLRARYRFEQGHDIEAVEDIIATMVLSRHVTRDGTVGGFERGYILESTAIFVVAAYLPGMSPAALDTLAVRLRSLPQRTPLRASILNELKSLDWLVAKVEEADRKSLQDLCCWLTGSDAEANALLNTGGGAKGLLKLAVEMRPLYEEAARLPFLPFEDGAAEQRLQKKIDENPLAKVIFSPDIHPIRTDAARIECQQPMLRAAIDVVKGGREALHDHADPYRGGAFKYEAFNGGFQLTSQWEYRERPSHPDKLVPVKLTVGIRKD